MSERQPYEEQLPKKWDNLALPDEDLAWEDMRLRLEEKRDDRIIPWWRRGCMLWALLLVIAGGIGWWLISQKNSPTDIAQEIKEVPGGNDSSTQDSLNIIRGNQLTQPDSIIKGIATDPNDPIPGIQAPDSLDKKITGSQSGKSSGNLSTVRKNEQFEVQNKLASSGKKRKQPPTTREVKNNFVGDNEKNLKEPISVSPGTTEKNRPAENAPDSSTASSSSIPKQMRGDSVKKVNIPDTLTKVDSAAQVNQNEKKQKVRNNTMFFSAGLALQQQIPIDSQSSTPYNASGRKGTLADYIPSVYFRLNKKEKWFLQLEFKYGAPQYTRSIQYYQKAVFDTGTNSVTTTSSRVKKTYYHQLPLSFHYHVLKNWTVGTGITWNRLSSAVTEQSVRRSIPGSQQDSLVSYGIFKVQADSVFARSYFQAVFETQYQWKKISVGARYSFGLQPYIRFTLPGGVRQEEKNSSLQVFLRYQFWKGKEFKRKKNPEE